MCGCVSCCRISAACSSSVRVMMLLLLLLFLPIYGPLTIWGRNLFPFPFCGESVVQFLLFFVSVMLCNAALVATHHCMVVCTGNKGAKPGVEALLDTFFKSQTFLSLNVASQGVCRMRVSMWVHASRVDTDSPPLLSPHNDSHSVQYQGVQKSVQPCGWTKKQIHGAYPDHHVRGWAGACSVFHHHPVQGRGNVQDRDFVCVCVSPHH